MIKVTEIANAIAAIDVAISFITATTEYGAPGRQDVRDKLITSRVDLEFALRGIKVNVSEPVKIPPSEFA